MRWFPPKTANQRLSLAFAAGMLTVILGYRAIEVFGNIPKASDWIIHISGTAILCWLVLTLVMTSESRDRAHGTDSLSDDENRH